MEQKANQQTIWRFPAGKAGSMYAAIRCVAWGMALYNPDRSRFFRAPEAHIPEERYGRGALASNRTDSSVGSRA